MPSSPLELLPQAFLSAMETTLGKEEFVSYLRAMGEVAPTTIRLNPYKPIPLFADNKQVPWCPDARYLSERPIFTLDPLFHSGAYYVQEASSMFINHILNSLKPPQEGIFLDLCAAPGGKSTLLSTYLGPNGLLVANEVIGSRTQTLRENCVKWGIGNIVVTQNDAAHFQPLSGLFDVVLVDAPCSGEGLFRKDPEATNEWSSEHVIHCARRQQRILEDAAELPQPGGLLLYATCTHDSTENEENIRFLAENYSYTTMRIPTLPEWDVVESEINVNSTTYYGYRFYPHKVDGEGFFVSVMRRQSNAPTRSKKLVKEFKHPHLKRVSAKQLPGELTSNVQEGTSQVFYGLGSTVFTLKEAHQANFELLANHLNLRYMGISLGDVNGVNWIPSHEWAISILPKRGFPSHEVSLDNALRFLRKETFELSNVEKGWLLITYQGLPLGWVKNLGNRFNNYYPKEWRIRMS